MIKFLPAIIYIVCSTGGIAFMKLGGDSLKFTTKGLLSISMNWSTFFGFLLYIISFLIWQKLVVKYDLSMMVPILTGIVQVVVLLIGHFLFKENLSSVSTIGAILVIVGIVLMALGKK